MPQPLPLFNNDEFKSCNIAGQCIASTMASAIRPVLDPMTQFYVVQEGFSAAQFRRLAKQVVEHMIFDYLADWSGKNKDTKVEDPKLKG